MGNLVKMDFYRMRKSKSFIVNLIIVSVFSVTYAPVIKLIVAIMNKFVKSQTKIGDDSSAAGGMIEFEKTVNISEIISSPFCLKILLLMLFISIISFTYADMANGYVKNIAGQLPKRGYTVVSKFIVMAIHNTIFMLCGLVGRIIGELLVRSITFDSGTGRSIVTFILKLFLLQSICSILLFITTGLGNKTFASVIGVVVSTGVLGGIYMGLDYVAMHYFKAGDSYFLNNAPDQLLSVEKVAIINAILVSGAIIAIFLPLTIKVFNKKDVK